MNDCGVIRTLKDRIHYLQGLALGLNISIHSNEGKILVQMIDILADLAEIATNIQSEQEDLKVYIGSMNVDLTNLEETVYEGIDDNEYYQHTRGRYTGILVTERDDETCFKVKD